LQVALLDVALRRNSVICLGSSSAKQFLAVMLIKQLAYQTRYDGCSVKLRTLALFNTGKMYWVLLDYFQMYSFNIKSVQSGLVDYYCSTYTNITINIISFSQNVIGLH